jgi:hypothetical protein
MKHWSLIGLAQFIILAGIFCLNSCSTTPDQAGTGTSGVFKERGVYTTIALSGHDLDLPGSGYASCRIFSSGQVPAAVVTGFGYYDGSFNRGQDYQLQLVESASGGILQTFSGLVYAGKANVVALPIRKTGKYQLRLIINGSVYDTWDFEVDREASAATGTAGSQSPAYAKGNFSASVAGLQNTDAFNDYDDSLLQALNDAVQKELDHANRDDFAQTPAGHIVIQFDLSAAGQVTAPQILENTLSPAIGQFFLRALQSGAPYKAWPANARAAIGADTRVVKVTFYYD